MVQIRNGNTFFYKLALTTIFTTAPIATCDIIRFYHEQEFDRITADSAVFVAENSGGFEVHFEEVPY